MMLKLGGVAFSQGRSSFRDTHEAFRETTAKIYIPLLIDDFEAVVYAQLDTGAAWSVLDTSIARSLGLLDAADNTERLDSRFGSLRGRLVRLAVRLLADQGEQLETEGTFFISPDWPLGRTFLGYSGLLDSFRFALDPQANHFYFGP